MIFLKRWKTSHIPNSNWFSNSREHSGMFYAVFSWKFRYRYTSKFAGVTWGESRIPPTRALHRLRQKAAVFAWCGPGCWRRFTCTVGVNAFCGLLGTTRQNEIRKGFVLQLLAKLGLFSCINEYATALGEARQGCGAVVGGQNSYMKKLPIFIFFFSVCTGPDQISM